MLLKNRNIDLDTLIKAIEEALDRLKNRYKQAIADQSLKTIPRYSHKVMDPLRFLVGFTSLKMIQEQANTAAEAIEKKQSLPICSGAFRQQYGLPCRHEIYYLMLRSA